MKFMMLLLIPVLMLSACLNVSFDIEELKQFGTEEFSKETWASGKAEKKGSIIYDYLNRVNTKPSILRVKEDLGESTAYYMYDTFPAYYIGKKESHILVFITDEKTGEITDIELIFVQ